MKKIIAFMLLALSAEFLIAQTESSQSAKSNRNEKSILNSLDLPAPIIRGQYSLEEALLYRRSVRQYQNQSLTLETTAQLLWAGQGITDSENDFRNAPSAGAAYPIELYLVIRGGVYVYDPIENKINKIINGDIRSDIKKAALQQQVLEDAPCSIIIAGEAKKLEKYANKARDFMLLEAGHIAQNISLQAITLGLASVPIGTFDSAALKKVCKLKPGQEPLYILAIGYPTTPLLPSESDKKEEKKSVSDKKAVIILSDDRFSDRETFDTMDALSIAGLKIDVAGLDLDIYEGDQRGRLETSLRVDDINVDSYDAVILVSGRSIDKLIKNTRIMDILYEASAKGKVIAAIGKSARVIANSDLVRGYKVTGDQSARSSLRKSGAIFTGATAERDDKLITAQDYRAASQFARLIVEAVSGVQSQLPTETGRYVPRPVLKRRGQLEDQVFEQN